MAGKGGANSQASDHHVILGSRFRDAAGLAIVLHAGQVRKSTTIPYLAHLLAVASLVLEAGGDEDQACAGLLHDAIEDAGGEPTERVIKSWCGPRVARIVRGCSDTDQTPKPPWEVRKRRYLWHLEHDADSDVLLVSLADKLHNLRATVADRRDVGSRVWDRFNAGRDDQLRYYRGLLDVYERRLSGPLTDRLGEALTELEELEGDPVIEPPRLLPLDPSAPQGT